ncbi:uroporphyrinogen-III synthase [Hoeflea ulvae]|uniref:uroporphyrinogen-III synthase n=1 Tax=Hoeflea ulvae TaxID=2983764 RepID=UPI003CCCDA35
MRVLVTRPGQAGSRTARRLTDLGHDPVLMPLFRSRVVATPDDLPPAGTIAGFIATSARALALFEGSGGPAPGFRELPVHVVGPATAEAARKAGFGDILEGQGTAEALARSIIRERTAPRRTVRQLSLAAGLRWSILPECRARRRLKRFLPLPVRRLWCSNATKWTK